MDIRTLDEFKVDGKTVLVRIDINSPVEDGKVLMSERIKEHAATIKELSEKGAKVVLMAHQGRPGDEDFTTMEQHARLLTRSVGKEVKYVNDVCGETAQKTIKKLKKGQILLLENVRMNEDEMKDVTAEEHAKSSLVKNLAPLADLFVSDAFSVAHRAQASVVGFAKVLPSAAGRIMERELKSLEKAQKPERPCIYILGGAKPKDSFKVMKYITKGGIADRVLTCGVIGNVFLLAKLGLGSTVGVDPNISKFFADATELEKSGKVEVPVDVAIDDGGKRKEIPAAEIKAEDKAFDIGRGTVEKYKGIIAGAKTIVMNGPPGKYEEKEFSYGTIEIMNAVTASRAFSLTGGGDTISAIGALGANREGFSYISLGGHALLAYLTGEKLPGIEVLKR
jgi:phosphoglycerate kinase